MLFLFSEHCNEVGKGFFPDDKPENRKAAQSCNGYGADCNSHNRTRGQTALIGFGGFISARVVACPVTRAVAACGFVFVYRGQTDFTADGKGVNFFGADDVAVRVLPPLEYLAFFGLVRGYRDAFTLFVCACARAAVYRNGVFYIAVYRGQTDFTADGKGVNFFGTDDVAVRVLPPLEYLAFFGLCRGYGCRRLS